MKTFKDLEFRGASLSKQAMIFFDNGYGATVVQQQSIISGREVLYDIGVLKGNEEINRLCFDTPITSDVIGRCDEDEITKILKQIQELPKVKK
jgi:hypothetical protein